VSTAIELREIKQSERTNDSSEQLEDLQNQVKEFTEKIACLEQVSK